MKIKKTKSKFIILTTILSFSILGLLLFSLPKTRAIVSWGAGWGAGIWNNYVLGHSENDSSISPTIGWLKSSSNLNGPCLMTADSADYEVYFEDSGSVGMRYVSGKAWFGIGSNSDTDSSCEADLPSLGWLNFEDDPGSLCSGQSDCHAARWHKDGDDDHTGYLDGYAHIESMGENGWVRLRGSNNGEKYAVRTDNDGILSGYAWNSGVETDSSLVGNQGLGWIMTDGMQIAECELDSVPKELCQGSSFTGPSCSGFCPSDATCTPNLDAENHFTTWICSRGCGSKEGEPVSIVPEFGQCGPLNGKSLCDKSNTPAPRLCSNGTPSSVDYSSALSAEWTCGNDCGEKVTCSATTKCGWTETNP